MTTHRISPRPLQQSQCVTCRHIDRLPGECEAAGARYERRNADGYLLTVNCTGYERRPEPVEVALDSPAP